MSWEPSATLEILKARAQLNAQIRSFFHKRDVVEVETPIANPYAVTDLYIDSISIDNNKFLHSSPEFAMKRLLAFHKSDIYQLCKVFRANETGRFHHNEFTMLEWYRVGMTYQNLMKEVAELVTALTYKHINLLETEFIRYQEIFKKYVSIDIESATQADYLQVFADHSVDLNSSLTLDQYQELVLDQIIVPKLEKQRMTFVYDYPAEQAALAQLNQSGFAERFELYFGGIELANGFQELTNGKQQLSRFEEDNRKRLLANKKAIEIDEEFISALESGLPKSAGVALGVDRLLMVMLGVRHIDDVLSFP